MSETRQHRIKWNQRYKNRLSESFDPEPHPMAESLRSRFIGGNMLDAACGLGRGVATAGESFETVFAVDISDVAVKMAKNYWKDHSHIRWPHSQWPQIKWIVGDVTQMVWPKDFFGLVCAFGFTNLPFFSRLKDCIKPGGMMLYEGFSRRQLEVKPDLDPEWTTSQEALISLYNSWEII